MKRFLTFLALCCAAMISAGPFAWECRIDGNRLLVTCDIAPGYYFYRSTLVFDVRDGSGRALWPVTVPKGEVIADDMFGQVEVYTSGRKTWIFQNDGPFVRASVNFQGCRKSDEKSAAMCFMPETVVLRLPGTTPASRIEDKIALLPLSLDGYVFERKLTGYHPAPSFSAWIDGKKTAEKTNLAEGPLPGFLALAGLALLAGLGLNLTPCVLPMIPVTLAIIGAGRDNSGRQGFLRGLSYGSGMAAAYGVLGLAVMFAGARFGELQSSMLFNIIIAVIFLLLSLAMGGVFDLDFSRFSAKFRFGMKDRGRLVMAFLMGGVSALLAGACVVPVAVGLLLLASERYAQIGFPALFLPFLLGAGMALPWPFAGAGLAVLPKPGKFMVGVKYLFAAIVFCAALWYGYTAWELRPQAWNADAEIRRFDAALADAAAKKKDVIIDFQASWCKNCRAMKKVLAQKEIAEKLKDFEVIEFRAESLADSRISALLRKWDIPGLPAFVLLRYDAGTVLPKVVR